MTNNKIHIIFSTAGFYILCGIALFAASGSFVNREVMPKWYWGLLCSMSLLPFNEYLLLLVNFGLFGLFVLILFLYRLWQIYKYNTHKTLLEYMAYWCLLSIAVFSMFSYPLTYPFVWVMGLSSITICFEEKTGTDKNRPRKPLQQDKKNLQMPFKKFESELLVNKSCESRVKK